MGVPGTRYHIAVRTYLVGVSLDAEGLADGDDLEQKRQVPLPADSSQNVRVVVQHFLQCENKHFFVTYIEIQVKSAENLTTTSCETISKKTGEIKIRMSKTHV